MVNTHCGRKRVLGGQVILVCRVKIDNPDIEVVEKFLAKGDNVMLGYYKDPEGTKVSFTEDGWFRTGDLGYLDKNAIFCILPEERKI